MYVFLFYSVWIDLVDLTRGICTDMRSFDVCICLWQSLIVLRWPCAADRTLQSLLTQVWSEWYYWLVTILKYSYIIAKSLAWYFNVSCLFRGEDSCNPRFDQSWKNWPLVPVTPSNWEWATAASSSHTSAGWTCHTCRLPLSHICRLNLLHLCRLNPLHTNQCLCGTGIQTAESVIQDCPADKCQTSKLLARGNGGTGETVGTDSSTEKDCRLCFWCWTDYLSMTHQNAEVQHAWILMAPPPI